MWSSTVAELYPFAGSEGWPTHMEERHRRLFDAAARRDKGRAFGRAQACAASRGVPLAAVLLSDGTIRTSQALFGALRWLS